MPGRAEYMGAKYNSSGKGPIQRSVCTGLSTLRDCPFCPQIILRLNSTQPLYRFFGFLKWRPRNMLAV